MMNDDLQVTGLIGFSFKTRIGDHVMDLAGACHFLLATKSSSPADHQYLKQLILAKHGVEVIDRIWLYVGWFAFDVAFSLDDARYFLGVQT